MKRIVLVLVVCVAVLTGCAPNSEAALQHCLDASVQAYRATGEEVTLDVIDLASEQCTADYEEDPEAFLSLWG